MDTVGTFEMAKKLAQYNMLTCISKHNDIGRWRHKLNGYGVFQTQKQKEANSGKGAWKYERGSDCWQNRIYDHICPSIGIKYDPQKQDDIDYLTNLQWYFYHNRFVCIDAANGYTRRFCDFIKRVREEHPALIIIAGNVVTGEMTEQLILNGADIVKVGIGSGSVCTTRIQTGVGYPQLSAIIECADAAHGLGGHIMADGGCVCAGDVAKAFAGGADFVMLGGMLAGHEECDGELVFEDDVEEPVGMEFYGMASQTAMDKHGHSNREYRGEEGKTVTVPYRGPVEHTANDILGGIRSACTYVGAKRLKDLTKCTTFVRVNDTHNRIYEKQCL